MEDNDLTKESLSEEGKGYLKDFNLYLNAINMKLKRAAKKGEEIEVSKNEMNKLNRLSKSVVVQIYSEMKKEIEQKEKDKVEETRLKEESEALKKEQEEEEAKIKAQNEESRINEEVEKRRAEEEEERKIEEEKAKAEKPPLEIQPKPQPTPSEDSDELMDFFF